MVFDWDDAYDGHDALDRLHELRAIRSDFRCTLFAIPGRCTPEWCESLPDWIELAVHGWLHPTPRECADWSYERMAELAAEPIVQRWFVRGWKSPGWQISDDTYRWLLDNEWWVADQHLEDGRRPPNLRTYFYENGGWHGHIDNVCGNGIEETWERVVSAVRCAEEFRFCSESASVGVDTDDSGSGAVLG